MENIYGDLQGGDALKGSKNNDALFAYGDGNLLKALEGDDVLDVSSDVDALDNTLAGGSGRDTLDVGVQSAVDATISGNTLGGGGGGDALNLNVQSDAAAEVFSNTLGGGKGSDVLGINAESQGAATVNSNTLGGGGGGDALNINITQSDGGADVTSNTLNGGGGSDTLGIEVQSAGDVTVTGNVFLGGTSDSGDLLEIDVQSDGSVDVSGNRLEDGAGNDVLSIEVQSGNAGSADSNVLNGGSGKDALHIDVQGTSGASAAGNNLNGGGGSDTLGISAQSAAGATLNNNVLGGGKGADVMELKATGVSGGLSGNTLNGGKGGDQLVVQSVDNQSLQEVLDLNVFQGNGGEDVLKVLNGGRIDAAGGVSNIEKLDLQNGEYNSVSLDAAAVMAMTDGDNRLRLLTEAEDTVDLTGWTFQKSIKGGYFRFFSKVEGVGKAYLEVKDMPVANADVGITDEDNSQDFDVLANDTEINGAVPSVAFTLDSASVVSVTGLLGGGTGTVSIVANQLRFEPGTDFDELDAGDNATVVVKYIVLDENGVASESELTLQVAGVNDGPVITSDGAGASAAIEVDENQTGVTSLVVDDPDADDTLTFAVSGGVDQAFFSIDSNGNLSFVAAPDFENAGDDDGDNVYEVEVEVTDASGETDSQSLSITVEDVLDEFDLADLQAANGGDGSEGFVIYGVDEDDRSGFSVSSAGDVNGDGFDDLLIGASRAGGAANETNYAGETYVVFGKASGWSAGVDLSALDGSDGFVLYGVDGSDYSGWSVSDAGDINGDGIDDLLIGARGADGAANGTFNGGDSYVVFGKTSGWAASVDLSALDGSDGFVLHGVDGSDQSAYSVSSAGDVNGDGFDDLLIGAIGGKGDGNGMNFSGETYVVFGKGDWSGSAGDVALSNLDGSDGFVLYGADAWDQSGVSVSSAGDVNGDGFDDLLVAAKLGDGAGNGTYNGGETYVVFGKAGGWASSMALSSLQAANGGDGSEGLVLYGVDNNDYSAYSVASAGDVNGDGFADLLIGARGGDGSANGKGNAGEAYLVYGKVGGWSAGVDLSTLLAANGGDGGEGFVMYGVDGGDYSAWSVAGARDVNGDGFDDLLIGSRAGDAGATYVLFGKEDRDASVDLDSLSGSDGFVLYGVDADDFSGRSVSSAGDVNGDGFDDLLIGARYADGVGNGTADAGESYVFFGRDFTEQIDGSGSAGADYLVGSALDDSIEGLGGADVISGGAGDDILGVGDLTFFRIDGGNGEDTLRLDGSGLDLDLTTVPDARLQDIEVIDLNGNGNTLTLTKLEVLNLSSEGNIVRVMGDASNSITTDSGWTVAGTQVVNTITYDVYTQDEATLLVQQGEMTFFQPLVPVFELGDIDGSDGFVLNGVDGGDESGKSVSSAGDVNGDGFDDLLVGALGGDSNGNTAGESYVVFGKAGGWGASVDLSTLDGSDGFVLNGVDAFDRSGASVSGAGDVNGDGFDDLLVGAWGAYPNGNAAGESYVVFGKGSGWGASVELSMLDGGDGFVLNGVDASDESGISVSAAGDVNGDGFGDLLVGAPRSAPDGNFAAGESYVVFGKAGGWGASVDLSTLDGGDGFVLNGVDASDESGSVVSGAGDVNGDGFDDLLVGANLGNPNGSDSGESYVVFGKAEGWGASVDLSILDGSNGFVLNGVSAFDQSGISVSAAGDVNGDGFGDLLVGAFRSDPNGIDSAGESYVVFGKAAGWGASVDLSALDGSDGFVMNGVNASDRSGRSVSGAGDVNGDGFDDLLVGAYFGDSNGSDAGESYVVFGQAGGWGASLDLSMLDGSNGFVLNGVDAGDRSGSSVSSAGDVNGDGFDDLLIGAYGGEPNGNNSGESYVFFGRDFTLQINASGSAGADYLVGSALDDTLAGLGGADAISGGAGDDVLAVSDLTFSRVDGGNGEDTLRLGSSLDLDLTTIPDTRLQDLEVIDLNGNNNTLTLTKLEVLNLSSDSNTLRVMGSGVNSVTFSGFVAAGTEVIDTVTYDVYTSGEATLQLQQGLTLNVSPVVIDLNGDGVIDYQALGEDGVDFDADGDGRAESVAWVGPNDGFLVFDANGDHLVTDRSELALSDHAEGARTDLEGLAMAFDTDGNGSFDSNDDDWSRFGIWQDKDQDGITDEGEFFTMEEAGIEAIDLALVGAVPGINDPLVQTHPVDGVTVFGETKVQFVDGTQGLAADVGLGFQHGDEGEDPAGASLVGVLDDPMNEGSEADQSLVAGIDAFDSGEENPLHQGLGGQGKGTKWTGAEPVEEVAIPEVAMQEDPLYDTAEEEFILA